MQKDSCRLQLIKYLVSGSPGVKARSVVYRYSYQYNADGEKEAKKICVRYSSLFVLEVVARLKGEPGTPAWLTSMKLIRLIKIMEMQLHKYPKIYKYAKRLLSMSYHDQLYDFQGIIDDFATTPRVLYFRNYGDENVNIPIYYITYGVYNDETCGFWGMVNTILKNLIFADFFHLIPVIEWHGGMYSESIPVHGSTNVWEYYFQPVSKIKYQTVSNSAFVCPAVFSDTQIINYLDKKDNECISGHVELLAEIYAKYISLNSDLEYKLNEDIHLILGNKRTMGCHARGSDGNLRLYGHPVPILPEEYLEAAYHCFIEEKYEQVFLATEDPLLLRKFSEKFGDSLVFYKDALRSAESPMALAASGKEEMYHYRMGYEVLRDAYTLARCDSLVGGTYNVPLAARIIKRASGQWYKICNIIDHGICYEKNFYKKAVYKR